MSDKLIDVYSLSDPTTTSYLGGWVADETPSEMITSGTLGVLREGSHLQVVDLADPRNLAARGSLSSTASAPFLSLQKLDDGRIIAQDQAGFHSLDLSDPDHPGYRTTAAIPSHAKGTYSALPHFPDRVFMLRRLDPTSNLNVPFAEYDVSDPAHPVLLRQDLWYREQSIVSMEAAKGMVLMVMTDGGVVIGAPRMIDAEIVSADLPTTMPTQSVHVRGTITIRNTGETPFTWATWPEINSQTSGLISAIPVYPQFLGNSNLVIPPGETYQHTILFTSWARPGTTYVDTQLRDPSTHFPLTPFLSNYISIIYRPLLDFIGPSTPIQYDYSHPFDVQWATTPQLAGDRVRVELWNDDGRLATLGEQTDPSGYGTMHLDLPGMYQGAYSLVLISVDNPNITVTRGNGLVVTGAPIAVRLASPAPATPVAGSVAVDWTGRPDLVGPKVRFTLMREGRQIAVLADDQITSDSGSRSLSLPSVPPLPGYSIGIVSLANTSYQASTEPFAIANPDWRNGVSSHTWQQYR